MFNKKGGHPHGFQQYRQMGPEQFGQFQQPGMFGQGQQPGMFGQGPFGQGQLSPQQMVNPNWSSLFPGTQSDRLQFEIRENRRRITNLTRRITRLENYLRIRDTSDYVEEDQIPNEFSM